MPLFSVVVPVFNRPAEVDELLQSLAEQSFTNFDVVIVEDGSTVTCKDIVEKYRDQLTISYYFKDNSGPGLSRNFGAEKASGFYIVFFDSDCIIPEDYFDTVVDYFESDPVDAWGGPDREHPSFTNTQKAINYSMTSFFTTGGIRGGRKKIFKFHPRSFNMGFTQNVFETTGGFSDMRFGEDIDMSIRIEKEGFHSALIQEAFVYHKRRTDLRKFFRQVYNSGIARINLYKLHPESLKITHFLPAFFVAGIFLLILLSVCINVFFLLPILLYGFVMFFDALILTRDIQVAVYSVAAGFVQLTGYGLGFINAFWKRVILGKGEFHRFTKTFYK